LTNKGDLSVKNKARILLSIFILLTSPVWAATADELRNQTHDAIKFGKYEEAEKALVEWKKIEPESALIPVYEKGMNDLKRETDPEKKQQIMGQLGVNLMNSLLSQIKGKETVRMIPNGSNEEVQKNYFERRNEFETKVMPEAVWVMGANEDLMAYDIQKQWELAEIYKDTKSETVYLFYSASNITDTCMVYAYSLKEKKFLGKFADCLA
jgi:hypothetical protein